MTEFARRSYTKWWCKWPGGVYAGSGLGYIRPYNSPILACEDNERFFENRQS